MVPFRKPNPDITEFQQDNARPHTTRITREYMQQENVEVLPWLAYSPDLSPIEHPKPENRQQLVAALQEEWANIPQDSIRLLLRSMRRRCMSCVQAHGGHIPCSQLCDFHIWNHYHVTAIEDSYCTYSLFFVLECLVWYQVCTCVQFYSKILYNSKMVK